MSFIAIIAVVILISMRSSQRARIDRLERAVFGTERAKAQTSAASEVVTPQKSSPAVASVASEPTPVISGPASEVTIHDEAVSSSRILAAIGLIAVFIGTAFFLNYAFENNLIPPAGRVFLGITAGGIMLGIGQFLRGRYREYSDALMGGGLGLFYLSIFSAHFFYALISSGTTWFLMLLVAALGFAISIWNATKVLALVSTLGAFLAPFMVGSNGSDMMTLFGYLTIVNVGVLAISFFKKWPSLTLAAFFGTMINFLFWFVAHYRTELLAPTLSFVFVTFLIFLGASVGRILIGKERADEGDYLVLAGNAFFLAVTGFTLLAPAHDDVLGAASVFAAFIHGVVAFMVNARNREDTRLNIFLPGLAVTFLSIAVPLQFDGSWMAVGWLVEALALYIISVKVGSRGFQAMGAVSYVLGMLGFLASMKWSAGANFVPVFNNDFGVLTLAIVIAYAIAYFYHRYGSVDVETQKRGVSLFSLVANILTIYAVSTQITFFFDARGSASAQNYSNTMVSLFWAIYASILTAIGFTRNIPGIRRLGLVLFIMTGGKVFVDVWNLGQIYRIASFIVFGIIALSASFAYVKYKDKIKEIV